MDAKELREVYIAGLFIALAFILPIGFHAVGLGAMFTPMLLPLLFIGFVVHIKIAVLAAVIAPSLSCFLTGMPPIYPPIIIVVIAEALSLVSVSSILTHKFNCNLYLTLLSSIILGKITAIVVSIIIANIFNISKLVTGISLVVYTLPGVALQLIVVPVVYNLIKSRMKYIYESH